MAFACNRIGWYDKNMHLSLRISLQDGVVILVIADCAPFAAVFFGIPSLIRSVAPPLFEKSRLPGLLLCKHSCHAPAALPAFHSFEQPDMAA